MPEYSQHLQLLENQLRCFVNGDLRWSVDVADVVLIAEFTTNEGPYVDDYFIVFVTLGDNQVFFSKCSLSASGLGETLKELEHRLGSSLQLCLFNSTEWNSRVMWPISMAGKPYYTLREVRPGNTLEAIHARLFGSIEEYRLSEAVIDYLQAIA